MLDDNVIPTNYAIEFDVDLRTFKFSGKETITLEVKRPTNRIVLHATDLKIKRCKLVTGGKELRPHVKTDEKKEELALTLSKKIAEKTELFIEFKGALSRGLAGFYKSTYTHRGKKKYLATTQFEPADARRAFPCFDEPAFKATFDVALVIDENLTAISNMPVIEETSLNKNKKRVVFAQTPLMSTYLLYLGVGEFEFLEDRLDGVHLRVATTPGKAKYGSLALEYAKKILAYYNDYFGISYVLPKLDLIAVPDFAMGAMENWGAVTCREIELFFDPKVTSTATKQRIAELIAHELAHQWFGNLVTMKWWNDLWLNEAFATWMGYKVVDHFYPEWEMWSQFLNTRTVSAFGLDALKSSHPIHVEVKTPHEANEAFDEISYHKGGSVLRMLESYLGEDVFRRGLRVYMKKHRYGNTTARDLWAALEDASGQPIGRLMDGWIKRAGYPLVEARITDKKLALMQSRFLLGGVGKAERSAWMIPLVIEHDGKRMTTLLKEKRKTVEVAKPAGYIKLNAGQTGFYRVKYDEHTLSELKTQVFTKSLSNYDRWGIQNDVYALARACELRFDAYLELTKAYAEEDDYLVIQDIANNLYWAYFISTGKLREDVKHHACEFYRRALARLGWDPRPGEKATDHLLRTSVLIYLGRIDDEDTLTEGHRRFQNFLRGESLHPDLRAAVYRLVAWAGDLKTHETLTSLYKKAENPEEKRRLLASLAGFKDTKLLDKTLEFSLSPDVRFGDTPLPVVLTAMNPSGRELAWPWVKKNWKELVRRYGRGHNIKLLEDFVETIGVLTDASREKEIKEFFRRNPTPGIGMVLSQSLERIRINRRFLEYNEPS